MFEKGLRTYKFIISFSREQTGEDSEDSVRHRVAIMFDRMQLQSKNF